MKQTTRLVEAITKGIQEKKGQDIVVADLTGIDGTIANYFIICQGNSPTQVEAITESIGEVVRTEADEKPMGVVGLGLSQWVAMDYGTIIVHLFLQEAREFYDLEHLWADAEITEIPNLF